MLRRLLMLVLALCLAAPAVAVPVHCAPPPAPVMAAMHEHHHQPVQKQPDSTMAHDCIGCIAPYSGAIALMPAPMLTGIAVHSDGQAQMTGISSSPVLPPPRS